MASIPLTTVSDWIGADGIVKIRSLAILIAEQRVNRKRLLVRLTRAFKIFGSVLGALAVVALGVGLFVYRQIRADPFMPLYAENCGACHGESFEGAAQGPALVRRALAHGDSVVQGPEVGQSRAGLCWAQVVA